MDISSLKTPSVDIVAACHITTIPKDESYTSDDGLSDNLLKNLWTLLTTSSQIEYTRTLTISNPLGLCTDPTDKRSQIEAFAIVVKKSIRLFSKLERSQFLDKDISILAQAYIAWCLNDLSTYVSTPLNIRHIVVIKGSTREEALIFFSEGRPLFDDGEVCSPPFSQVYSIDPKNKERYFVHDPSVAIVSL